MSVRLRFCSIVSLAISYSWLEVSFGVVQLLEFTRSGVVFCRKSINFGQSNLLFYSKSIGNFNFRRILLLVVTVYLDHPDGPLQGDSNLQKLTSRRHDCKMFEWTALVIQHHHTTQHIFTSCECLFFYICKQNYDLWAVSTICNSEKLIAFAGRKWDIPQRLRERASFVTSSSSSAFISISNLKLLEWKTKEDK